MNVVVGPFSVFEIPSGATASLLRSKRQIVSTIPCASIRAVTVRQLSASESFFVSPERIASSVAWQQGLSSKITREQQIPCWASLGFFPGCRGLEASLGRRQRRITYASIHTFAVWQFCFHIITLLIFQASSHSSISSVKSSSIKEDLCLPYLNVTCHGVCTSIERPVSCLAPNAACFIQTAKKNHF
jgi:hypothetical protein